VIKRQLAMAQQGCKLDGESCKYLRISQREQILCEHKRPEFWRARGCCLRGVLINLFVLGEGFAEEGDCTPCMIRDV